MVQPEARRLPPAPPVDAAVGGSTARRRVLVAEDDPTFRALLRATLEGAGYRVTEATDGGDLLERLADAALSRGAERDLALVVTDLRMPGLSGLDALHFLRTGPWRRIPVILITAFGDAHTHAQARALGVAEVFDKPFDLGRLCARVEALVPLAPRPAQTSSSSTSRSPSA